MRKTRPTARQIERASELVRAALDERGVLLEHDATLPSATRLIAGAPIRGSWWGHAQGALIYEALGALEDEVVWAKLLRGKETLIHRRLWPALVAIGKSREEWQMENLSAGALELLKRSDGPGELRADALPELGGAKAVRELFRELEKRLLVHSRSVHTEQGHHVRVLSSWPRFHRTQKLGARLPEVARARQLFEQAVQSWGVKLLPWTASQ